MAGRQLLIIDPPTTLKFKGPFNVVQTTELKLFNPTNDTLLFKIKTTAPKRYCVRPNSGSAAPQASVVVSIMLQPSSSDSDSDRSKHKFMVQSLVVPSGSAPENYDALWKDVTNLQTAESRLKCAFEEVDAATENGASAKSGSGGSPGDMVDNFNNLNIPDGSGESDVSENQRLRQQISQLTDECARLRETELRLRRTIPGSETRSKPKQVETTQPEASTMNLQVMLVSAFVALIIGIILGKLL